MSINESWLCEDIEDSEIAISGYTIFRRDRPNGSRRGGVALYMRNELQPVVISEPPDNIVESVFVKIKIGNKLILVGSIYRPPNALSEYWSSVKLLIEHYSQFGLGTIIMEDLNFDINDERKASTIYELELIFQLKQLIKQSTRVTSRSATLIDLIFTNMEENHIDSGVLQMSISDHLSTYTTLSFRQTNKPHSHKEKHSRIFKQFNESLFLDEIANSVVFNNIHTNADVNNAWKSWKLEFLEICNKHAPIRSSRVKHASNPWITRDILNLINKKNYL